MGWVAFQTRGGEETFKKHLIHYQREGALPVLGQSWASPAQHSSNAAGAPGLLPAALAKTGDPT